MREVVTTPGSPGSPFFSQAVRAGPFVFVSGTTGVDPGTGQLAGSLIGDQTRQALTNCRSILEAAGSSLDDVVEVGILIVDPDDFGGLNEEWTQWFTESPPTRWVGRLGPTPPGVLISIRMTAYSPGRG